MTVSKDIGCSATIGFFDGVHKGHRHVIACLVDDARRHGLQSAIITFRQHPRQVLRQDYVPQLLTMCEKKEQLLWSTGVDNVVMLDFTPAFSCQTAVEFMTFLRDEYNVRRLVVGYDHRFGHDRAESFLDYKRYGARIGVDVVASEAFVQDDVNVSSSVIRRLLANGDLTVANDYLGYDYGFDGIIVRGRGEGRKLGFPTANMLVARQQLVPKRGVYSVGVEVEGIPGRFAGMMNIGCRPTYGAGEDTIEVNIFNFDTDIYGRRMSVSFLRRLRDERKFRSVEDLKQQLCQDRENILSNTITF